MFKCELDSVVIFHFFVWLIALLFTLYAHYNSLLDRSMAEETLWLTVSLSVILYCFTRYQDKLLLLGFSVYILGQLFDVLDTIPLFTDNLLVRFDTGLKNLGFIVICVSLFKRVYEKRNLITRLTAEIEQKTALQKQLEYAATHDELTKVPNRKALFERLNSNRTDIATLLYMDLDNFKQANDEFGHATGDMILIRFCENLSQIFGKCNVYRLGGDEFVVLNNTKLNSDRLTDIELQLSSALSDYKVGVSIGQYHIDDNKSPDQMINLADLAMYKHKTTKKRVSRAAMRS